MAANRRHIDIDIRTRPLGRPMAIVIVAPWACHRPVGSSPTARSMARYASIVFIPLILLVALGLSTFSRSPHPGRDPGVAVSLDGRSHSHITPIGPAGRVAAALAPRVKPGDFSPTARISWGRRSTVAAPGRYQQITFRGGRARRT